MVASINTCLYFHFYPTQGLYDYTFVLFIEYTNETAWKWKKTKARDEQQGVCDEQSA